MCEACGTPRYGSSTRPSSGPSHAHDDDAGAVQVALHSTGAKRQDIRNLGKQDLWREVSGISVGVGDRSQLMDGSEGGSDGPSRFASQRGRGGRGGALARGPEEAAPSRGGRGGGGDRGARGAGRGGRGGGRGGRGASSSSSSFSSITPEESIADRPAGEMVLSRGGHQRRTTDVRGGFRSDGGDAAAVGGDDRGLNQNIALPVAPFAKQRDIPLSTGDLRRQAEAKAEADANYSDDDDEGDEGDRKPQRQRKQQQQQQKQQDSTTLTATSNVLKGYGGYMSTHIDWNEEPIEVEPFPATNRPPLSRAPGKSNPRSDVLTVLCVGEKPSIAATVASALANGAEIRYESGKGTPVHEFEGMFQGWKAKYRVTSVTGHMYR